MVERMWERAFYEGGRPPPDIIAQSRYMAAEILDSYAVPPDHVHIVPNAVDTSEYSPEARQALRTEMRERWSIPDTSLCLLFLGHNFRLKGLWQMLEVLPTLRGGTAPVHLLVAGRGTGRRQRAAAERRVREAGLDGRVTFAGAVRPSLHALAAADALIHLSWHDSFGFVALEAMACGLPVVTTPYVGASELIDDGVSGLIVDPARDEQIREAIVSLSDAGLREDLGRAAAAVAAAHDESRNFERVLEVFTLAASRRTGPIGGG
jgi:UDP-glucose:(heptosyl)LPS alpha-1,3-glucosyltransferase